MLGVDPARQETEPGARLTPLDALAAGPVRIVPAGGRTPPRTVFDHRCAQEVAAARRPYEPPMPLR
ncbi:hypothetical protein ACFVX5_07555, partial [Streptomyces cacaoi]